MIPRWQVINDADVGLLAYNRFDHLPDLHRRHSQICFCAIVTVLCIGCCQIGMTLVPISCSVGRCLCCVRPIQSQLHPFELRSPVLHFHLTTPPAHRRMCGARMSRYTRASQGGCVSPQPKLLTQHFAVFHCTRVIESASRTANASTRCSHVAV